MDCTVHSNYLKMNPVNGLRCVEIRLKMLHCSLTHMMRNKKIKLISRTAHAGPWNIQSSVVSRIQVHSMSSWNDTKRNNQSKRQINLVIVHLEYCYWNSLAKENDADKQSQRQCSHQMTQFAQFTWFHLSNKFIIICHHFDCHMFRFTVHFISESRQFLLAFIQISCEMCTDAEKSRISWERIKKNQKKKVSFSICSSVSVSCVPSGDTTKAQ